MENEYYASIFVGVIGVSIACLGINGCSTGPVLSLFDSSEGVQNGTEKEVVDDSGSQEETETNSELDTGTEQNSDSDSDDSDMSSAETGSDTDEIVDSETDTPSDNVNDSDTADNVPSDSSDDSTDSTDNTDSDDSDDTDDSTDSVDSEVGTDGTCNGVPLTIPLDMTGEYICAGSLAERLFRFALCTCNDVNIIGDFRTNSFDSSNYPSLKYGDFGGAVGINGKASFSSNKVTIGGTAIFAGDDGVSFTRETTIYGDLKVAGDLDFLRSSVVYRDAQIGGKLYVNNFFSLNIERDIYIAGSIQNSDSLSIGGELIEGSVSVDPPCPCSPSKILDIESIVEASVIDNNNEAAGIDPDHLANVSGTVSLNLECGRYYLSRIKVTGKVTITVNGPTALFIGTDFEVLGDMNLEMKEDAEIDIFVVGNLSLVDLPSLWDITKPSDVRLYVEGESDIILNDANRFNLYAPNASVKLTGDEFYGSIVARDFTSTYDIEIHADQDTVKAGRNCAGNNNTAEEECLVYGEPCEIDDECCIPLVCSQDAVCDTLIADGS